MTAAPPSLAPETLYWNSAQEFAAAVEKDRPGISVFVNSTHTKVTWLINARGSAPDFNTLGRWNDLPVDRALARFKEDADLKSAYGKTSYVLHNKLVHNRVMNTYRVDVARLIADGKAPPWVDAALDKLAAALPTIALMLQAKCNTEATPAYGDWA